MAYQMRFLSQAQQQSAGTPATAAKGYTVQVCDATADATGYKCPAHKIFIAQPPAKKLFQYSTSALLRNRPVHERMRPLGVNNKKLFYGN
ncbi:hypothetical protein I5907_09400 [Panacibacter sp. DH6]|uniref:Uncharacterized protein n=1 Tax=Panacibacter microcysteis TaxID=2793269 RepID=A0A931E7D7_9BACT|nr:hypothetical protein [Panacibacter microcysteis]MBG9376448.1 hypothetical protein [Panacibacter microcysteis]